MNYRSRLVALTTFLGGAYFFLEFVLPAKIGGVEIDRYHEQITLAALTVGSMAVGLGLTNLLALHGSRLIFRRKGMFNSLALLIGLAAMTAVMIADWRGTAVNSGRIRQLFMLRDFARVLAQEVRSGSGREALQPRIERLESALDSAMPELDLLAVNAQAEVQNGYGKIAVARREMDLAKQESRDRLADLQNWEVGPIVSLEGLAAALNRLAGSYSELLEARYRASIEKRAYTLLYDGLFVPLGSAMFSLLAFYMAAAAYRAFRVRSVESGLMMAAAVVVMLGQIPFGLWLWSGFPGLRLWLLTVPNTAAFRGIAIGAAVAGLIMAFRMWLSIESASFGRGREGE